MTVRHPFLTLLAGFGAVLGGSLLACVNGVIPNDSGCAPENSSAQLTISGTYRYGGESVFQLRGTITFEQQGNTVRVVNTTYDNSSDRALKSEFFPLQGNKLVMVLTPVNGDADYRADVTLLFTDDARKFCAEFSDTNGDAGDLGTYTGFKQ